MLRWTSAGAVTAPRTVQIRVQRSYPGRIRAGAPVPTRSMSPREIRANVTWFTEGLRGPRTQPCTQLVLSGVGVATRRDTPDVVALARSLGVERIVLHVGLEDLDALDIPRFATLVDLLVVPVQSGSGALARAAGVLADAATHALPVASNTVLSARSLGGLEAAARVLAQGRPSHLTFTYPFPINGGDPTEVPTPARALAALRPCLQLLDAAGLDARIKGLPACHLADQAHRLGRTANRWYVDADHQQAEALLFFPDVVAFHKEDICRFCDADGRCDGSFAPYLRRPGFPPLRPLDPLS